MGGQPGYNHCSSLLVKACYEGGQIASFYPPATQDSPDVTGSQLRDHTRCMTQLCRAAAHSQQPALPKRILVNMYDARL